MLRTMCKGKLHRATVTQANLNYMGSITIDKALMKAANISPHEMVQITNLSNAMMWQTYAIPAEEGSGAVCLNGPPARHFQPGDEIVILSLGLFNESELPQLIQSVVFLDERNQILSVVLHPIESGDI